MPPEAFEIELALAVLSIIDRIGHCTIEETANEAREILSELVFLHDCPLKKAAIVAAERAAAYARADSDHIDIFKPAINQSSGRLRVEIARARNQARAA